MNVKTSLRTLAGAALVALAVTSMAVTAAGAERKGGGGPAGTCYATGATLEPPTDDTYVFFEAGAKTMMKDPSGTVRNMQCQKDGSWKEVKVRLPWDDGNGGIFTPPGGGVYSPASGGVYSPSTGGVFAPKAGGVLAQP
jgi:hypothetical protein